MAAVTALTRLTGGSNNNSFEGQGLIAYTQAYAATSAWVARAAQQQHVCYASLTGAMTINATLTAMLQFSQVVFYFANDGTERIVTFGTGFLASGTVTIPASKGATCIGFYDGASIRITSREIHA
jgi:hypothetical protein